MRMMELVRRMNELVREDRDSKRGEGNWRKCKNRERGIAVLPNTSG